MDPSYWEATTRHQAPKSKKSKATNSVERQFRKNPFAKALATPIRQCTASKTRLPAFFLQDFNLIAHPETGHPWWVPRSLAWDEPVESQQANVASDEPANIEIGRGESDVPEETPGIEPPAAIQSKNAKPYGPSAYVLARKDLISAFGIEGSGYAQQPKRLFGGSSSHYTRFAGKAVWRADMTSVILDRMRQEIAKDLIYLSRLCAEDSRHYIVKCHGWDDVQYKHQGAVLWFGGTSKLDEATKPEVKPGPFATYDISNDSTTTSVAVHNIPMLLGNKNTAEVREKSVALADGSLFMLAGRRTSNLQLKLWRLQGYLADHRGSP
ncbi:hypothetical protein E0Z10_g7489 [Xylaria hypoxylon]|uniref:Uncharacterized protein n=1 Tax=Xylaria hypoxylon TaxID=37992 RepID=A0A4Z0YQ13_9PEZI|nr:hypothetical protein E0Z10_g7489 [Xylaria hypoxylon]